MRRALVTGAASGIGAACAEALRAERLAVTGADLNASGEIQKVDVSDARSVAALFEGQSYDVVVNAAGILIESRTLEIAPEAFDRQIAVNLRGSFLVAQAALRAMPDGGSLTLIASELANLGRANFAAYCASKAGVIGLTRALAHEFAPRVRVNAVAPGPTDTPMLSAEVMSPVALALETQNPMGRIGTPQEIAAAVVFLASPGASFMTGQTICPSGGAVML